MSNPLKQLLNYAIEAITSLVYGFVVAAIFNAFTSINPWFVILLGLVNLLGVATFLSEMPHWGIVHIIGWILGTLLVLNSGLVGGLEIILNIIAPILIFVKKKFS